MAKICIICRKEKQEYNLEHILLATFGGTLMINTVCKACNEGLRKKFNEPFLKSEYVGYYRQQMGLSRKDKRTGDRKIANPFKKATVEGDNAKDYYVSFKNGQLKVKPKPKSIIEEVEGGYKVKIAASKEDVETVKTNVFKKLGVDPTGIPFDTEETQNPPFTINIHLYLKPLFLEALKVAYEFTVTAIPEYFNDEWSLTFAEFLNTGELIEKVKNRIESISKYAEAINAYYSAIKQNSPQYHLIVLKQYDGIGLLCFVKLFEITFVFHVSDRNYFKNNETEIVVVNDAINCFHQILLPLTWKNVNVDIGFEKFSQEEAFSIRQELRKGYYSVCSENQEIPIYKDDGNLIAESLSTFVPFAFPFTQKLDLGAKKVWFNLNFLKPELFVKYKPTNRLLPLKRVYVDFDIAY